MPVETTVVCLSIYFIIAFVFWLLAKLELACFGGRKAATVALLSPVWPVAVLLLVVWGLWFLVKLVPISSRPYRPSLRAFIESL